MPLFEKVIRNIAHKHEPALNRKVRKSRRPSTSQQSKTRETNHKTDTDDTSHPQIALPRETTYSKRLTPHRRPRYKPKRGVRISESHVSSNETRTHPGTNPGVGPEPNSYRTISPKLCWPKTCWGISELPKSENTSSRMYGKSRTNFGQSPRTRPKAVPLRVPSRAPTRESGVLARLFGLRSDSRLGSKSEKQKSSELASEYESMDLESHSEIYLGGILGPGLGSGLQVRIPEDKLVSFYSGFGDLSEIS